MADSALHRNYAQWITSRLVLDAVQQAVAPARLRPAKVEAALENAIMRLLLDLDVAAPDDLFAALKQEHVARGFQCVGADPKLATAASSAIESVSRPPMMEREVANDPDELRVGKFRLAKSAPVRRLMQVAETRLGEEAVEFVAASALRYASIYARTRHIGPPQGVYDMFHDWGVRNEGFASPFNARLLGKPDSGFFSAFADCDGPFGSRGSFFAANHREFEGSWCVDPPFLEETMSKTDTILQEWRAEGWDPGVILIVPSSYEVQVDVDDHVQLSAEVHQYEGLDGSLHPLPVDVSIYRLGTVPGWDPSAIVEGYHPLAADVA